MRLLNKMEMGAAAMDARDRFDPAERRKHMNASEAETCLRRQWYQNNKPSLAEEQSWGYARRGNAVEKYVVDVLKLANVDIRYGGADQKSLKSGLFSATPDGVIVDHENEVLIAVEIKSIDPRVNKKKLPRAAHVTQLGLGMCMIDEHAVAELGLPDWNMSHGVILYVDASNFDDVVEKVVPYDPTLIEAMEPRAKKLLTARSANAFQREGKIKGGLECKNCPFSGECLSGDDVAEGTASRALPIGTRLDRSVQEYVSQKTIKEVAEAGMKEEAERIKAELKKRKVNEITVGGHKVTLTQVAGRKTLDKKALETAGVKIEDYEKVGNPSERLTIT